MVTLRGKTCFALLLLAMSAAPGFSQDQTPIDKRISDLEKKIEQLVREKEAAKVAAPDAASEVKKPEPVGLRTFYDRGSLYMASADGSFKYWLDGRVDLDAANYQGAENRLASGAEIRRARLGLKGTIYSDWLTEIDVDFADSGVEVADLWMGYAGFRNSVIRAGNHKAPFGMDTLTSSKYTWFIDRAYAHSWAPDRRLGISYSHWGKNWQASAGVFGQPGGTFDDKSSVSGAGASHKPGIVGRFSYAPLYARGRSLHLGISAAHMQPDVVALTPIADRPDAASIINFDSRPETHVSRAKFLSTGAMPYVDYSNMTGLELAGVFDSFSFQSEYQRANVVRFSSSAGTYPDHTFSTYYGQVSWFPTGEVRPYSPSEGDFGRIIPKKKYGAVELALRLSSMDLNDTTRVDPIAGGSARNVTLGANWYLNPNMRVMFNAISVNNDQYAHPGADWAPIANRSPVAGDDFMIYAIRFAVAF